MGQEALALLLTRDGLLYTLSKDSAKPNMVIHVNCNDTFYYACADSEELPDPEWDHDGFWSFYDLVREHGGIGAIKWAALRRKQLPIGPHIKSLKELGLWDEDLESLIKDDDKFKLSAIDREMGSK